MTMELRVVELFAGVGGFRVGLNNIKSFDSKTGRAIENNNWNFVWANQFEPSTKDQSSFVCYSTRFGLDGVSNQNIIEVDKKTIPEHDLLVGGFPCQDYSVARSLSNELGIKGKKGVLWWEIAEILSIKKPKVVLLENVDRLLKSPANQRGRDFAIMLKTFDQLGYIVEWRVINPASYGMPQKRKRVFILATHKDISYSKELRKVNDIDKFLEKDSFFNVTFPVSSFKSAIETLDLNAFTDTVSVTENYKMGKFLTSGVCIDGKVYNVDINERSYDYVYSLGQIIKESSKYNSNLQDYVLCGDLLKKWADLKDRRRILRTKPNGDNYYYSEGKMNFPDKLELPGRTMLTSEASTNRSSHVIYDETINNFRKITEVEAELLQMFPPNWTNTGMSKRRRYFVMGNALVTGVISMLEPKLKKILTDEKK